jgi:proteasome lid subunit RPN8/RPN11
MRLDISAGALSEILAAGEGAYPEESVGLLLGEAQPDYKRVTACLRLANIREEIARRNRYLLSSQDYLSAEEEAARLGLDVVGIFHSHPDHPNQPSDFDREWALPWFSYLITAVRAGKAQGSRSWRLAEDRSGFIEEEIVVHK